MKQNNIQKGQQREWWAIAYLLGQGYEVFKNVSLQGPIDVVAWKNGYFYAFDIKTVGLMKNGNISDGEAKIEIGQRKRNIQLLSVTTCGKVFLPKKMISAEIAIPRHSSTMLQILKDHQHPSYHFTFHKNRR